MIWSIAKHLPQDFYAMQPIQIYFSSTRKPPTFEHGDHIPRKSSGPNSSSDGPTSSLVNIPDTDKVEHSQIISR